MTTNYLLAFQANPSTPIDLSQIRESDFIPAVTQAIQLCRVRLDRIRSLPVSFRNTILGLDQCDDEIFRISLLFSNFSNLLDTDALRECTADFFGILSRFQSEIFADPILFEKVSAVLETKDTQNLTHAEVAITKKFYNDFIQNGAHLNSEQQADLGRIDGDLQMAQIKFSENLQDSIDTFSLQVTEISQLRGLSADLQKRLLVENANPQNPVWQLTLRPDCYENVLKFCQDRKVREKMWVGYHSRSRDGHFSNKEIVKEIVTLRQARAKLFGFSNFANFILQDRMIENAKRVNTFLDELKLNVEAGATSDLDILNRFARENDGPEKVMPWDYEFYGQKLRNQVISEKTENIREYFELTDVLAGAFSSAEKLFDIHFHEEKNGNTYHSKVRIFRVEDNLKKVLGYFHVDLYERDNKKSGAWTSLLQKGPGGQPGQRLIDVVLAFNFSEGDKGSAVLLNPHDVIHIFHELGHALHEILDESNFQTLSGTNVAFDFIEFPSQIMENWARAPESVESFARHFQTREPIPSNLAKMLLKEDEFQKNFKIYWQVAMAKLDLAWHQLETDPLEIDVETFEQQVLKQFPLEPEVQDICRTCIFTHLFQDSYAASFYTYVWSRILADDCFTLFQKSELYNRELGKKLRNEILSKGGIESPWNLTENFLGRKLHLKELFTQK